MPQDNTLNCDIAIIGGGVAGLWLLNLLRQRGYDALLCESLDLGGAQSIASQGMIHGGIKYALGAALTGASEAIARMPQRWRSCLAGTGELDLSAVKIMAHEYHMWSDGKLGKLSSFFASTALRGRVESVARTDYPDIFDAQAFNGTVHQLNDLVLDVSSLLSELSKGHEQHLVQGTAKAARFDSAANMQVVTLADGRTLRANQFVFTAGAGNTVFCDALRDAGHSHAPATQLRGLHQAFVRHPQLEPLYAHCITGIRRAEPRLTITTHCIDPRSDNVCPDPADRPRGKDIGWYIGGHLATEGVKRNEADQIEVTRRELTATLPWIDWRDAHITTLRVDRAEPRQHLGLRPDEACLVRCGNAMLCWPIKLSLVPDLGDQVLNAIDPAKDARGDSHPDERARDNVVTPPKIATPPWLS